MGFVKGMISALTIMGTIICLFGASYHFKRSPLTSFFLFFLAICQFALIYYLYNQDEE